MVVIFIALLASAYHQYRLVSSTAALVDTTSSITNKLVLDSLAHEEDGSVREYVIDPDKIASLDFRQEVGGENFEFQLTLRYKLGERVLGPHGLTPPEGRAVCAITVPVVLYENNRLEYAKLEVRVWRA